MKKVRIWLLGILLFAAALRLYQLGAVPASPDWDETALGYNAYSILKTGRDEYGSFLPLVIRSFDDYKPPLYTYLTVPSVALFDLSVWSTRLPSALFGILAVAGVYVLVKAAFGDDERLPLLSSFLLAVSPWHIQFSRIAFEANIGVTLNIWAAALFLKGLQKRTYLVWSAVCFAIAMYAYHSERVFAPLLFLLLTGIFRKQIFTKANRRAVVVAAVTGVVIVAPLLPVLFSKAGMLRLQGTSTFSDQTNLLKRNVQKLQDDRAAGNKLGEILDNRRFVFMKSVWSGYVSHFSIRWLFLDGDNPRHHAPDMGMEYLWEMPFILYGLFILITKYKDQNAWMFAGWFLLAPVAASPTTGLPHSVRTMVFLPSLQVFCAIGILRVWHLLSAVRSMWVRNTLYAAIVLAAMFNGIYYLDMYYAHLNPEYSEFWQYGYKAAVEYTEKNKSSYDKIVVSTGLEQSYMFFLFYTKYDPASYHRGGGTLSGDPGGVKSRFDKYEFRNIDWTAEKEQKGVLYVGSPREMPHGNVASFSFLNGKPAIEMADVNSGLYEKK